MERQDYLKITQLLDFENKYLVQLVETRGWRDLSEYDRIGAIYNLVRE